MLGEQQDPPERITGRLSDEAFEGWSELRASSEASFAALLEAIGCLLREQPEALQVKDIGPLARQVDDLRRRRKRGLMDDA